MEWIKNTSLVSGLEDQIKGVETALKTIDGIVTIIDTINQSISDFVNVINSVGTLPEIDPNLTAIQAVQKSIKDLLDHFTNQGLYILPIFSLDINDLKGGITAFNDKIAESFTDPYDKNRPVFSNTAYTAGVVVMFDSGLSGLSSIEETFKATQGLLAMFNMKAKEIKISDIDMNVVCSDKVIQFNWGVMSDDGSVPADSYVIYRMESSRLNQSEHDSWEILQNELELGEAKKVGIVFPQETLRFEDKDVVPFKQYVYFFVRYVELTPCKILHWYLAELKIKTLEELEIIRVPCSNLQTIPTGLDNLPNFYVCMQENKAFIREENRIGENIFGLLCRIGKNVCPQLTIKKCKNDNGEKCTSSGYTINKSRGYAKNGTAIPILNSRLYISAYCKNGTNAQVCDGYKEEMIYNYGKEPNWSKFTAKSFLPEQLFSAFDFLYSFVDMMASTLQKQDYAISLLSDEIKDTGTALKNSILQIRNVLEGVIKIINIQLPATYTLKIEPSSGGTTAFINSLKSATKGPIQNADSFNTGFVVFYGSNDKTEVDVFYSLFSSIF